MILTPPCIDAILSQQTAIYEIIIKLKQENESSQQLKELVQLGERFFKQMKKDVNYYHFLCKKQKKKLKFFFVENLEIKHYLAEKARRKVINQELCLFR